MRFLFGMICFLEVCVAYSQKAELYVTAKDSKDRLTKYSDFKFGKSTQPFENEVFIVVDPSKSFQTIEGIGGAMTDAAAETFSKLSKEKQAEFLKLYFDEKEGIGYSLGRTNINSCDFSSDMYTYVKEGDKDLTSFDLSHDMKYKIPLIKAAFSVTNGKMKLFVSPWSPPAFMKDNNNMLQGGKLKAEYYQSWANYFVKFINGYEKEGIPVWGLTVQNEPMAKQTWESCIYTAEDELNFIKKYLGPTLQKNKLQNKKLIAWDHNRDLLYHRAMTLFSDPDARKYIWAIGFHWYENWNGGWQFSNLQRFKESFPGIQTLLTEACNYPFSWETINDWKWGEIYGQNMIEDFNNGAVAWTDWNILLDEVGGPNHVKNYCFAPIHAKTQEGSLHLMNSYYYIGHFSKFVRPGAKRISTSSNRAQISCTGFKNTDGSIVLIYLNKTDEKFQSKLILQQQETTVEVLPHSIGTFRVMPK